MAPSDPPAGAFLCRAASHPETPCLFYPEGVDWRWWSRREAASGVRAWAAELSRHSAGSRAAFLYRSRPLDVALDLAVQVAGLVAEPLSETAGAPAEGVLSIGGETAVLSAWSAGGDSGDGGLPRPGGGAVVGGSRERVVTAAGLSAAAAWIARQVGAALRGERHEIVVSFRPLSDPLERALLCWAFTAGAAVLLEPYPRSSLASVAWARPTLFAGSADEIRQLRTLVEGGRRGWRWRQPGLPFGRLRLILAAGPPLIGEEAAFWQDRGTRLVEVDPPTLFDG